MDFFSNLAKSAAQSKPDDDNQEKSSNYDLFGSAKVVAAAAQSQFGNEPEKYDKVKVAGASADLLGAASDYGKFDETQGFDKYANQAEGYLRQYGTPQTTPTTTTPVADTAGLEKTAAATDDAPAAGDYDNEKIAAAVDDKIVPTKTADAYDKIIPTKTTDADEYPTGGAEDGGAGDYIKKAAGNYLSKPTEDAAESGGDGDYIKKGGGDYLSKPSDVAAEDGGDGDYIKKAGEYSSKPSEEEAETGGADDYIKKAGGFLNKPSGDGGEKTDEASSEPGGGYGGLMKTAGGFFNKN